MKQKEIRIEWLATFAFVLALLGDTTALILLFLYAIALRKNEWLTEQVGSAMVLAFLPALLSKCYNLLLAAFAAVPFLWKLYKFFAGLTIIVTLAQIAAIVFIIIALPKVWKGQAANVPFIEKAIHAIFEKPVKKEVKLAVDDLAIENEAKTEKVAETQEIPE